MSGEPLKTIRITGIEKLKPRVIDVDECASCVELQAENERLKSQLAARDAVLARLESEEKQAAEDAELIDEAFVRSLGFANTVVHGMADDVFKLPILEICQLEWGRKSRSVWLNVSGSVAGGIRLGANWNRDQLRRLIEALETK